VPRAVARAERRVLALATKDLDDAPSRAQQAGQRRGLPDEVAGHFGGGEQIRRGGAKVWPEVVDRVVSSTAQVQKARERTDDAVDVSSHGGHRTKNVAKNESTERPRLKNCEARLGF